jgi:dienelactone hydrolase
MSCPACFSGGVHEGTPTGEETTMHGRQVYIAKPLNGVQPKGIVIFITDAFGWQFVNNKLLCDAYAHKGQFMVIMPDFFNGSSTFPLCQFDC